MAFGLNLSTLANLGRATSRGIEQNTEANRREANQELAKIALKAVSNPDPQAGARILDEAMARFQGDADPAFITKLQEAQLSLKNLVRQAARDEESARRFDVSTKQRGDLAAAAAQQRGVLATAAQTSREDIAREGRESRERISTQATESREGIAERAAGARATQREEDAIQRRANTIFSVRSRVNPDYTMEQALSEARGEVQPLNEQQFSVYMENLQKEEPDVAETMIRQDLEDGEITQGDARRALEEIRKKPQSGVIDTIGNFLTDGGGLAGLAWNVADPLRVIRGPR